jgi:maltooligosyltrehalose trehalohydrolase
VAAHAFDLPFGATVLAEGRTRFRLWAPGVDRVGLEVEGLAKLPMIRESAWFCAEAECGAGARYRYRLPDGLAVPDPASRRQDGDVHGHSVVVDPRSFAWRHGRASRPWREAVVYEVHAGLAGGFAGIARMLPGLAEMGFTAIELMPVADFPGQRNWGYDGALLFAPDEAYGTVDDLKALVDAAHGLGLMVLLDVVYNHFGPDGNYLHAYAPLFFDEGQHTPWGAAIDFRRPEVGDYFVANALYWLEEYQFDGLRLDAVHAITPQSFLDEFVERVRAAAPGPHAHLVLEHEGNRASLLGRPKFDAQWADDFHHCLHVLLTGETEGYYADFADAAPLLARALAEGFAYQGEAGPRGRARGEKSAHLPPSCFVFCLQNHDQIGNRAMGDRLTRLADPRALKAATALLLLNPHIPLVFMGEEQGSRDPFLFFTDHNDELAPLVRDGRRREFAHFAAFADEDRREAIPDPNAAETFRSSVPRTGDPEVAALYRTLLHLRARHVAPHAAVRSLGAAALGKSGVLARWSLGGRVLAIAANLGEAPVRLPAPAGETLFETEAGAADRVRAGELPGSCTVALLGAPS